MNRLEEALAALSAAQVAQMRALLEKLRTELLTPDEFVTVAVALLLKGNAKGYALGAATARAVIEFEVGKPEITDFAAALDPTTPRHLDPDRLSKAVETIVGSDLDDEMQLDRIADNEPAQAATDGSHDVIRTSKRVIGWQRMLEADACELCMWLKKAHLRSGGYVYAPDQTMHRHVGCRCEARPFVVTYAATDSNLEEE